MGKLETKTEHWPLDRFKPDPQELARHDDLDEIRLRGQDMLDRGQLQPVAATVDGRMIYGHGRLLAAQSAGIKMLDVEVYPAMDDTQFILTRTSENLQRKELTGWRKWRLCDALIAMNGWDQKTLAKHLNLHESSVTRLVSPSRCIQEAQDALRDGKITVSDAYAISKLDEADQPGLLALKLSGASRDALEQAGRKKRNGEAPAVRASKIPVRLSGDVTVTISGPDLSLDEAIEAVKEATKEMTKGRDQGLDARTLVAVCRDKAKAGG